MFLEYDFTVVYKLSRTHVVVDALLKLLDITKPTCVLDQTTYASLFYTRLEWLNDVNDFLRTRQIDGMLSMQQKKKLVKRIKPFTFKNGELYKMGQDNRLQQHLITT